MPIKTKKRKPTKSRPTRVSRTKRPNSPAAHSNTGSITQILKFMPAMVVTLVASFLLVAPNFTRVLSSSGVLAYATNTSRAGLLSATNTQRANYSASALSLNSKLNTAAQNKANDMVSRNYWSHETPDGDQPWVFFNAVGYAYLAAGENLAYGFADSNSTVIGWMNSPSHKANLISTNYTEVGFGIANSSNYVSKGPQTIVVAMYGKPQVASAQSTAPSSSPVVKQSNPKPVEQMTKVTPVEEKPVAKAEEPKEDKEEERETIAVANTSNTITPKLAGAPTQPSRIQLMTGANAAWSVSAIILAVCSIGILWLIHKGFHVKRYILASEHFLARHLYLDLFVLSVIFLGFVLLGTTGTIR